ncbi:gluconate 2-dehydrogenase subunit 3 family protein [Acidomonas methanolica]|uniref:gluconate 2-dehydrogenase subunit 3 family protein n=2 Tax=Acidomonas methanolica TaxID=437 RepID=UPI00164A779B|nr:gluconate 2-dehydrogenase subunit 3 family protein [Acidomonas methanolica]
MSLRPPIAGASPVIPESPSTFRALLESDHVTARTRAVMAARAKPVSGAPRALSAEGLERLRALLDGVLPQGDLFGDARIDLAERIDARLAGPGDGWRFAILPPDAIAYEQALATLDAAGRDSFGAGLPALDAAARDRLIARLAEGTISGLLDGAQMQRWFSDLRADAVQEFMAHPAVQGAFGISAVATGGDREIQGFEEIGADRRERWEAGL